MMVWPRRNKSTTPNRAPGVCVGGRAAAWCWGAWERPGRVQLRSRGPQGCPRSIRPLDQEFRAELQEGAVRSLWSSRKSSFRLRCTLWMRPERGGGQRGALAVEVGEVLVELVEVERQISDLVGRGVPCGAVSRAGARWERVHQETES